MRKYKYIYKTTNLINDKIYIGSRHCNCLPEKDKHYLGSGALFCKSLKKNGRDSFKKEIIYVYLNIDDKTLFVVEDFG